MFKIQTKDGRTEVVDISWDENKAKELIKRLKDPKYQETITGMSILKECGGKTRCPVCKRTNLICKTCGRDLKGHTCSTGAQYSFSRPGYSRKVLYLPEFIKPELERGNKGGERITVLVDGMKVVLMAHENQPALRVTLAKPGDIRYNPM